MCCAQAQATSVTEDFESVEVVDANGTPVASNYAAGAGLSNGWLHDALCLDECEHILGHILVVILV